MFEIYIYLHRTEPAQWLILFGCRLVIWKYCAAVFTHYFMCALLLISRFIHNYIAFNDVSSNHE